MSISYLNGKYTKTARILPSDRGFLFGDGVYEVITIYRGKFRALPFHVERLRNSLKKININISEQEFSKTISACEQLIKLNQLHNLKKTALYLQISRGSYDDISQRVFSFKITSKPTVFIGCLGDLSKRTQKPLRLVMLPDIRWDRCDIKAVALLGASYLHQQALEQGFDDALIYRNNHILESTSSNFFMVKNNCLLTAKLNFHILPGVTRKICLTLAKRNNIKIKIGQISKSQVLAADEAFITSSTKEIVPIKTINQKTYNLENNPITKKLQALYKNYINTL